MRALRNPLIWFTLLVLMAAVAVAQEVAPAPAPDADAGPVFDFATLVALVGAVVIIARVVVKLTPTPADDTFLQKVIGWLKHLGLVIKCLVLAAGLALAGGTVGCSVLAPRAGVTWEASRYQSFRDVWTTTLALYDHSKDLQVAGKISARDAADIDAAWEIFRASYKQALAAARGDETAFTPERVRRLASGVIDLVYAATN